MGKEEKDRAREGNTGHVEREKEQRRAGIWRETNDQNIVVLRKV